MSKKTEQLGALVQQKLNEIIIKEIELPAGVLVTLTKVEISPDSKYATVWLAVTPKDLAGVGYGKLRAKKSWLQRMLGDSLGTQFVPALRFRVDKSAMAVEEVEQLLEKIRQEG